MTTTPTIDLDTLHLDQGSHDEPPAEGCGKTPEMCLFEAYNWLIRHEFTDHCPPGVSRVLHQVGMRLNDRLPDAKRQLLKAFLPHPDGTSPLAGTAGDGQDKARLLMATEWALHTTARRWLATSSNLDGELAALDAIPAITSREALDDALPAIRALRDHLWDRRSKVYAELREKVRAKLAESRDAVAAAAAAAAAAADYRAIRRAAYEAAKQAIQDKYAPMVGETEDSANELYKRMVNPAEAA